MIVADLFLWMFLFSFRVFSWHNLCRAGVVIVLYIISFVARAYVKNVGEGLVFGKDSRSFYSFVFVFMFCFACLLHFAMCRNHVTRSSHASNVFVVRTLF